mgnify:FL=1
MNEALGWWVVNEMTWNFTDRLSFVISIVEDNNKKIFADQNLAFMKDGLLGGPFGEIKELEWSNSLVKWPHSPRREKKEWVKE